MNDQLFAVILVHSTNHAVRIERLLAEQGVTCRMIPVPRQLSSDCGACVRLPREQVALARAAIGASQIEILDIVEV